MVTRHSMQIPIPHKGPRASPLMERRKRVWPACARAAATTVPAATETVLPLTRNWIWSATRNGVVGKSRRSIRLGGNLRLAAKQQIGHQTARGERGGHAQSFVSAGQPNSVVLEARANEGEFVRRRR